VIPLLCFGKNPPISPWLCLNTLRTTILQTVVKMRFQSLAIAAAPLAAAQELMRFGCGQLTIDRIDPLVNPGQIPSAHMHQIVGGNSFNASMTPGQLDPPTASTCTTCTYSEDFSNYWTANIYFRSRNGTFKRVPQFANLGVNMGGGSLQGGATIYYIRGYQASAKVTAFKPVSPTNAWVRRKPTLT
jgi:hypothetical protein